MKIGILTSGGDCPGLNAVIRGAVLKGTTAYDHEFVGFRDGWRGVVDGDFMPLDAPRGPGHLEAGRHDPRHEPHQPLRGRARRRREHREDALRAPASTPSSRSAARARSPRPTASPTPASRSSACPRRSTTTSRHRLHVRLRHRRRTSPPRPWTACAPPATRTTAAWSPRSWAATSAGSPCTRAWPPARTPSCIPEQPLVDRPDRATWSRRRTTAAARRSSSSSEGFTLDGMDEAFSDKGLDAFDRPRLGGIGELLAPEIERTPASRRAPPCSATSSAAARRPASTACSPPASAWPPSTRSSRGRGADGLAQRHRHRARPVRRGPRQAQHRAAPRYDEAAASSADGRRAQASAAPTTSSSQASSNARSRQAL